MIRPHVAWYWRWLAYFLLGIAAVMAAGWIYERGMEYAGFSRRESSDEMAKLEQQSVLLARENADLRARLVRAERQAQIDRTTRDRLANYIKTLEEETGRLKGDLAFFHGLLSPSKQEDAVSIYSISVERSMMPGEYRYRVLLLQSGKREHAFQGSMRLLVSALQNGRKTVHDAVGPQADAAKIDINFRYYQRIEGTFQVAPDAVVKSVQVRIVEDGAAQPTLTRTVQVL
ncbi:MAG: DUF6776 family protein [Burkholderiales bacterium]